jgi:hypothetical protein
MRKCNMHRLSFNTNHAFWQITPLHLILMIWCGEIIDSYYQNVLQWRNTSIKLLLNKLNIYINANVNQVIMHNIFSLYIFSKHLSNLAGLNRCRKSCRLRWLNYLSPNIKRGSFAEDEIDMIIRLHNLLGNR